MFIHKKKYVGTCMPEVSYDSYDKLHNIHACAHDSIYRCTSSCAIRCERGSHNKCNGSRQDSG